MEFFYYDLAFLVLFTLFVTFFLIKNKKNVKVESKIFVLYRTRFGLNLINRIGSKSKKFFSITSYFVIVTGYMLMVVAIYMMVELLQTIIRIPEIVKIAKIPPIVPLIPYLPQIFKVDFLPPFYFTYWIISVAIIAIFHEFAHGIFARHYGITVKSTGFGFLGPFLAAFVEPDEKQFVKRSKKAQITILAAGSFANVIVTIIFLAALLLFYAMLFTPAGVRFDDYSRANVVIGDITGIGSYPLSHPDIQDLRTFTENENKSNYADVSIPADSETIDLMVVRTNNKTYLVSFDNLANQVKSIIKENNPERDTVILLDDAPALRAGIFGPIKSINHAEVRNLDDLEREMGKYRPGQTIQVEAYDNDYTFHQYDLKLQENPSRPNRAFLGVAFASLGNATNPTKGLFRFISSAILSLNKQFRQEHVFYMPKGNRELIIFIYNLLWWIVIINISVAIVNMLPLAIFDGGRTFFVTMWALTGSEKKAKVIFKYVSFAIILLFLAITVVWFIV